MFADLAEVFAGEVLTYSVYFFVAGFLINPLLEALEVDIGAASFAKARRNQRIFSCLCVL